MKISAFGITDRGVVREINEDAFVIDESIGLFVVADGMGGHKSGEVASRMAVDILHDYIARASKGNETFIGKYDKSYSREANLLASGILLANQAIIEAAASSPELQGMGTTVVAMLKGDTHAGIAHAGDSRLYLLHDSQLHQVTEDHSVVAEKVRCGILTREEGEQSCEKNIITRALGQSQSLEVDLQDLPLVAGDRILICSDGLSGMVNDAEIAALLKAYPTPEASCNGLVEVANDYGGKDNVTAVVVNILQAFGVVAGIRKFFGNV